MLLKCRKAQEVNFAALAIQIFLEMKEGLDHDFSSVTDIILGEVMFETCSLVDGLSEEQKNILSAVYNHCTGVLDNTHRFKFFTLHGSQHVKNMFNIASLLIDGGISLTPHEKYILSLSICLHDVGMVCPLDGVKESEVIDYFEESADPAFVENSIRKEHHQLIATYLQERADFFIGLGLSPIDLSKIVEIGKCHRVEELDSYGDHTAKLAALLRAIDELDISANRAPVNTLINSYKDFDPISCWHWFKHNICAEWRYQENVSYEVRNNKKFITFSVKVAPPTENSINYWMSQVVRPINKALDQESCRRIIQEAFGVAINVQKNLEESIPFKINSKWSEIEALAISSGKKVILVIDDEVRKMRDLFVELADDFFIMYAPNAKDAFTKFEATPIDLAIVDMQIGSGHMWTIEETNSFKATGSLIVEKIFNEYPETKVGILTGTQHDTDCIEKEGLSFFLHKPIDPEVLEGRVYEIFNK